MQIQGDTALDAPSPVETDQPDETVTPARYIKSRNRRQAAKQCVAKNTTFTSISASKLIFMLVSANKLPNIIILVHLFFVVAAALWASVWKLHRPSCLQ